MWRQLNWIFIHSSSGTLAHYNLPGPEPGSQGEFMVNKNVTFFNKVRGFGKLGLDWHAEMGYV